MRPDGPVTKEKIVSSPALDDRTFENAVSLTAEEQASNAKVMICCCGCKSERLVLDM